VRRRAHDEERIDVIGLHQGIQFIFHREDPFE
jgi:hypothetical protein